MDLLNALQTNIFSIIITVVVIILLRKYFGKQSHGRLPPGPWPIPLLGNLLQIDLKRPDKSYLELSKKYGSVFTVWLGTKPVVVISGYQAIKEALVNQGEEFNGRYNVAISMKLLNEHGVGTSNGQRWKDLRSFSMMSLKHFGTGCKTLEERVQEEAKFLVKAFTETADSTVNPKDLLFHAILNLCCAIVFGRRFEYNEVEFQIIYKAVYTYFDVLKGNVAMLYNVFPRIVECFPGKHQELFEAIDKAKAFVRDQADCRKETLDSKNPHDFFDAYLVKMSEEMDKQGTEFNYENLFPCVWDIFAAGTETQSSTLSHACLIMIKYPHIQEKVQKEIDSVIGPNRFPMVEDRNQMPYTNAVIHEIQRTMSLAPTAVPHQVNRDTIFQNYHIPKGTVIFPLLSSVLWDPKLFKNPDDFDPNNFLDEDGQFNSNDGFLAFGLGKRCCLGDGMGIPRTVLFIFFTSLLQHFSFRGTKSPEEIDVSVVSYFIGRLARPYTCYVKIRKT
ncbi:hypothetical protein UPYG_G00195460 [Umbra pygmaea]|uniref:Uncharacterized protein n=1 Tax=Umbra pygmaea TaxID=75934 RepID=A0ABD0WZ94_UMBPY